MLAQLRLQRPVQQPARQPPQQPVRARDLLRRLRAGQQRVEHIVAELQGLLSQIATARQPSKHLSPLYGSGVASLLADTNIFFLTASAVSSRGHDPSFRSRLHGSSDTPVSYT